jgi:hypothetical protein
LRGLTSIPAGFNPTIGGDLYLRGLTSIPAGFNPTVGGYLELSGLEAKAKKLPINFLEKLNFKLSEKLTWQKGKYRVFDGIFCEVLKNKKNIYKVKIKDETAYIVNAGYLFSHGKTIKEARENLLYKLTSQDTTAFKKWTLDKKISVKEAILSYRAITGACEFGVKNFCKDIKIPKLLTPLKVIEITEGQYGGEKYAQFFGKQGDK